MFKFGKEYKPYKAELRGTNNTVFLLPQYHRGADKQFVRDGMLNVLAKGSYELNEGDTIIVRKEDATGVGMQRNGQYTNFTLYAETVEIIRKEPTEIQKNKAILEDDIPDDLF